MGMDYFIVVLAAWWRRFYCSLTIVVVVVIVAVEVGVISIGKDTKGTPYVGGVTGGRAQG